jgi:hypothetical protein
MLQIALARTGGTEATDPWERQLSPYPNSPSPQEAMHYRNTGLVSTIDGNINGPLTEMSALWMLHVHPRAGYSYHFTPLFTRASPTPGLPARLIESWRKGDGILEPGTEVKGAACKGGLCSQ